MSDKSLDRTPDAPDTCDGTPVQAWVRLKCPRRVRSRKTPSEVSEVGKNPIVGRLERLGGHPLTGDVPRMLRPEQLPQPRIPTRVALDVRAGYARLYKAFQGQSSVEKEPKTGASCARSGA